MPELVRQLHRLNEMLALYVELLETQIPPIRIETGDDEES